MRKRDLTTLAMIGISLAVGGCQQNPRDHRSNNKLEAAEQMSPEMREYYSSLSPEAQKKFMKMDAQHRMMAMEMTNQSCNGKNVCSAMGGCQTNGHGCAGLNSCKGQGGSPIQNPEDAVDIQYNNQKQMRSKLNNGSR